MTVLWKFYYWSTCGRSVLYRYTHADGIRVSIVIIGIRDSVILSVCTHDKSKMAETKDFLPRYLAKQLV